MVTGFFCWAIIVRLLRQGWEWGQKAMHGMGGFPGWAGPKPPPAGYLWNRGLSPLLLDQLPNEERGDPLLCKQIQWFAKEGTRCKTNQWSSNKPITSSSLSPFVDAIADPFTVSLHKSISLVLATLKPWIYLTALSFLTKSGRDVKHAWPEMLV